MSLYYYTYSILFIKLLNLDTSDYVYRPYICWKLVELLFLEYHIKFAIGRLNT